MDDFNQYSDKGQLNGMRAAARSDQAAIVRLERRIAELEAERRFLEECEKALVECRAIILAPQDDIAAEWFADVIGFPSAIPRALQDRLNSHIRDFWLGFSFTPKADPTPNTFWTSEEHAAMDEYFRGK